MKLGLVLLALVLALAVPDVVARLRRRLGPREKPAAERRIETRFERVEKTRPLDPGHYYKRYWP